VRVGGRWWGLVGGWVAGLTEKKTKSAGLGLVDKDRWQNTSSLVLI
jgi:hypothetical protein